jgi:hypothetical protein
LFSANQFDFFFGLVNFHSIVVKYEAYLPLLIPLDFVNKLLPKENNENLNNQLLFLHTRRCVSCIVDSSKSFILFESIGDENSSSIGPIIIRSSFPVKLEKQIQPINQSIEERIQT